MTLLPATAKPKFSRHWKSEMICVGPLLLGYCLGNLYAQVALGHWLYWATPGIQNLLFSLADIM